jgi:hypothetical protein
VPEEADRERGAGKGTAGLNPAGHVLPIGQDRQTYEQRHNRGPWRRRGGPHEFGLREMDPRRRSRLRFPLMRCKSARCETRFARVRLGTAARARFGTPSGIRDVARRCE